MKDIRKINDNLFVGRSESGLAIEVMHEYRKDIGAEVWCVYVDRTDDNDSVIFITFTETLEQALDVAGKLSTSDLPAKGRYLNISDVYESKIQEDMAAFLSALTNRLPSNTSASWQLGYLTALNEMRSHMNTINNSEEID